VKSETELSNLKCQEATPRAKPYRIADRGGLALLITPVGGKLWRWRYRFQGVPVIFQEVVHSILIGEAVCDEQAVTLETEWTITRMPHGRRSVESGWRGWGTRAARQVTNDRVTTRSIQGGQGVWRIQLREVLGTRRRDDASMD